MQKKITLLFLCFSILVLNTSTVFAKDHTLNFHEVYEDNNIYSEVESANIVSVNEPSPYINSDGTFDFTINNPGIVLNSDIFKVSSTSSTVKIDAGAGSDGAGSAFYVTLMKKGVIDTSVTKVKYYTGGIYKYTFTGLNTSSKYYLKIDSNNMAISGNGSISNYVAVN